jgi:Tol biopolymer transport system component/predicted Ser/Thr protein kinase
MTELLDRLQSALTDRYVIERELGEGGMAMVYLATDVRHTRSVAIKVLKPEIVASLGQERFLREITVTAQLNHPRILPLLDSGQADGLLFYVMPYVEGESLRDRLAREGPLPLEEAVEIAREMAVALSYAHGHGVIHRDIKPENVLLSEGEAVVADFGIAKAITEAGGNRLTGTGLAVGTPAYMSPEQAAGERQVDARSDLYAVGCVLYEMLAGEPPYTGPTAAAITARKLTEPVPSLRTVREAVPANLEAVVGKALARAPADRYTTAQQLIDALNLARTPVLGTSITRSGGITGAERRWQFVALAAVVVALVSLLLWVPWRSGATNGAGSQLYRLSIPIAPLAVSDHGPASQLALSPDGTRLAYVSGPTGSGQLYVRALGGSEAVPITSATNAQGPFFSPDGQWLGFVNGDTLKKVRLADGSVIPLCRAEWIHGATWGPDGEIVFAAARNGALVGLFRVSADGGTPEPLPRPDSAMTDTQMIYPSFLPGGRQVLVMTATGNGEALDVSVMNVASGARRVLFERGGNAQYAPSGHLVYGQDGALFAVGFDPDKGELTGTPTRIVADVLMGLPLEPGLAHFSVSSNGTLVYLPARGVSGSVSKEDLFWVDPSGTMDSIPGLRQALDQADIGPIFGPRISPDASRILFWAQERPPPGVLGTFSNVWVFDLARRTLAKLSVDQPTWYWSIWTPDGRDVVVTVSDSLTSRTQLAARRADGTGPLTALTPAAPVYQQPYSISPDGRFLLFHQSRQGAESDIYVLDMKEGGPARVLLDSPAFEAHPALSPDGRWLAYSSAEKGRTEIYLTDFPALSGRWQVSSGGGLAPAWAPDGRRLYYQLGDLANLVNQVLMSTETDLSGASPRFATPSEVMRGPFSLSLPYGRSYDIAPDGTRFLMARRSGLNVPLDLLTVVLNWTGELSGR